MNFLVIFRQKNSLLGFTYNSMFTWFVVLKDSSNSGHLVKDKSKPSNIFIPKRYITFWRLTPRQALFQPSKSDIKYSLLATIWNISQIIEIVLVVPSTFRFHSSNCREMIFCVAIYFCRMLFLLFKRESTHKSQFPWNNSSSRSPNISLFLSILRTYFLFVLCLTVFCTV